MVKMKIFTYAFNHPTYLKYQYKCLKKFVKEPFEFYCIDNAAEERFSNEFKAICSQEGIHYVKNLKPDHSLAGQSHYSALQWSWEEIIQKTSDTIVMTDHDTFAVDYVSIEELLGDASMAGFHQARGPKLEYFHPSFMIFNTRTMPKKDTLSFKGALINDGEADQITDIGGETYYYFRDNPEVKRTKLKCGHIHTDNPFLPKDLIERYGYLHVFESIEGKFLHTRNGSNWAWFDHQTFSNRDKFIFELLDRRLAG